MSSQSSAAEIMLESMKRSSDALFQNKKFISALQTMTEGRGKKNSFSENFELIIVYPINPHAVGILTIVNVSILKI